MTVTFPLRRARVAFLLLTAFVWACTGRDPATSDDDSKQPIDNSKAGSSSTVDGSPKGGSPSDDPEPGTGNTGSVGVDEPDDKPPSGGKGNGDMPLPAEGEGGTDGQVEPPAPTEGFLRGEAFVTLNECAMCHTENFAGFTVFPNITPDEQTGIGSWTDEQIVAAIRDGVDPEGGALCETMARFPMNDQQAADVVEFLRGIPAVSNKLTSDCR
jgi:hypothetical protein